MEVRLNQAYVESLFSKDTQEFLQKPEIPKEEKEEKKATEALSLVKKIVDAVKQKGKYIFTYNGKEISLPLNKNPSQFKKRLSQALAGKSAIRDEDYVRMIAAGLCKLNKEYGGNFFPGCDERTSAVTIKGYLLNGYGMKAVQKQWNLNDSTERVHYLFGEHETWSKRKCELLAREWPGLPLDMLGSDPIAVLTPLAEKIIAASMRHPLYQYLYAHMEKNSIETKILLQHSVAFTPCGEDIAVSVRPPVGAVIRWIHESLRETVCPARAYTEKDFLTVAGTLAQKASAQPGYSITGEDEEAVRAQYRSVYKIDDILRDICTSDGHADLPSIQWTAVSDGNTRKFKIRLYRLAFAGIRLAMEKNHSSKTREEITAELLANILSELPHAAGDCVHIEDEFDDITMYTTSLLLCLNPDLSDCLIDKMCAEIYDYSVSERTKQIALIYILSYLLCEEIPLTAEKRERIFRAVYGRTMYKLQSLQLPKLFSTSRFYAEHVVQTVSTACSFSEDEKTALGQPEYLFLFGKAADTLHVPPSKTSERFLLNACKLRDTSWYETDKKSTPSLTITELEVAMTELNKPSSETNKEDILRYAYGMQMLGYAYANGSAELTAIMKKASNCERNFAQCLFIADFYCRLYNPLYSEKCTDDPEMTLPCGTFRAICTGRLPNLYIYLNDITSDSGESAHELYYKWFLEEKGRYKFLLAKLLLHLGKFVNPKEKESKYALYRKDIYLQLSAAIANPSALPEFMDYDRIDIQELLLHRMDQDKFLACLKG